MFLECQNSFTKSNVVREVIPNGWGRNRKARRANSVLVLWTTSLGASVDRRERVLMIVSVQQRIQIRHRYTDTQCSCTYLGLFT